MPNGKPFSISLNWVWEAFWYGGGIVVGFAVCSEKDETTMQGHFSKCTEKVRGASLFAIRSCSDEAADRYEYTNLEDDMGKIGLRTFKRSLKARIVASYTIGLRR